MVVQNTCPTDTEPTNGLENTLQPGLEENGVGEERVRREQNNTANSDTGTSDEEPEENDLNR